MAAPLRQQIGQHLPLRGQLPVFVVRLRPNVLRPSVHQHIARAGVEAERLTVGRKHADIGNAADVQHGNGFFGLREHSLVERWHQRRTLPAGGQIAAAEIAHRENARFLCQQRQVGQLDAVSVFGGVAHGLAVAADGADACRLHLRFTQQFLHHFGI